MSPIYPFRCQICNAQSESFQKFEDPAPMCEACAEPMKREIGTGTDFILRGNMDGFYGKNYTNRYLGGAYGLQSRKAKKNK